MDCFVASLLAMTWWSRNAISRSRGADHPRLPESLSLLENRGRREDRVRAAPAVSCARCTRKCAHEHTGSAETLRPSPRNGFTAYSALSSATGLFCHRRSAGLDPQNLTPASGRRDHTISPYASRAVRRQHIRVHRIPPRVRDDREPPLLSGETGEVIALICPTR